MAPHKSFLTLVLSTTILTSCTMVPGMDSLTVKTSDQWSTIPSYAEPEKTIQVTELTWEDYFNAPELRFVIGAALENNRDLKQAALAIEEARATYRISRADLIPNINAVGGSTVTKSSDDSSLTGRGTKSELYEANVGAASYELDLFGKIRSQNEAALNAYLSTEEAKRVVQNALIAEAANAYLQLLADQKLLSLTEKTLEAQKKTYDLTSQSLELGASTAQDASRALTAVELAEVNKYRYTRLVEQDKNALYLLLGVNYGDIILPETSLDEITFPHYLDAGVPSGILLSRPDVRQAEYDLRSANADIGAARAAFFPAITLTGAYGYASNDLSNLFTSGAFGAWSFVPQITLPIFTGGSNKANLDLAHIRKNMAIINYEDVIQTAFTEVSNELIARATLDEQFKAQKRLVDAAQDVYDKANARYGAGIDNFLSVLDAQRELYTYQQDEIKTQQEFLTNYINLYKALGGGV